MDLRAKSYAGGKNVYNTLKRYIDKLADFNGVPWGGRTINNVDIKSRVLEVGIPKGASKAQIQQMTRATKYADSKNVKLNIRVVD